MSKSCDFFCSLCFFPAGSPGNAAPAAPVSPALFPFFPHPPPFHQAQTSPRRDFSSPSRSQPPLLFPFCPFVQNFPLQALRASTPPREFFPSALLPHSIRHGAAGCRTPWKSRDACSEGPAPLSGVRHPAAPVPPPPIGHRPSAVGNRSASRATPGAGAAYASKGSCCRFLAASHHLPGFVLMTSAEKTCEKVTPVTSGTSLVRSMVIFWVIVAIPMLYSL